MVNYSAQNAIGNNSGNKNNGNNVNGNNANGHKNIPENQIDAVHFSKLAETGERLDRLAVIVEQTALAVLATTEVVERMGERIDFLSIQVQQQGQQFQQQGYQVYAITDAVQTLTENQADSSRQLNELMITLSHLAKALEHQRR